MSNLQKPIGSGFDAKSTAEDVIKGIDLTGKLAIVTGGYAGIGTETTRVLLAAGAKVIIPARDRAKAESALKGIGAEIGKNVEIGEMDLSDPASVEAFAQRFIQSGRALHLLINNAGIMACPLKRDARGYEMQFATNHLGHFQLTKALWPALVAAKGARVVNVSSWGHRFSPVHFEDVNFEKREYERFLSYGQSKTANILFAVETDKRGKQDGIRAYALHPGAILETDLARHLTNADFEAMGVVDKDGNVIETEGRKFKNIPQGAATTVWCATNPQLADIGGVYADDCEISPVLHPELDANGNPKPVDMTNMDKGVMEYAINAENAARLWTLSEELIAAGKTAATTK